MPVPGEHEAAQGEDGAVNARQMAEYRDELARCNITRREGELSAIRAAEKARPKRRYKRRVEVLPPKSAPPPKPTTRDIELAARLLPHVCLESVVDREAHALGVARMLRNIGAA